MNLLSHLRIARHVLAPYRREQGLARRAAFFFGNVRPDIFGGFIVLPHTPAARARLVNLRIARCIKELEEGMSGDLLTNYRLGIICHFIADFFCFAHNDWADLSTPQHFRYERMLNHYLKRRDLEGSTLPYAYSAQEIIEALWLTHKEYSALSPEHTHDLDYTARMCAYLFGSANTIAQNAVVYPVKALPAVG